VEYGHWVGLMRTSDVQSVVVWLLLSVSRMCACLCVSVCECECAVILYWDTCSPFSSAQYNDTQFSYLFEKKTS
jgi:hypothetical protein